ncbi:MAG: 50S ribosomal protein L10 [Roseibium sp.]|nr:50S ribosomal protein L10 [Roseibium sp.]
MERAEKHAFVTALNAELGKTGVVVVAHYAGLSVAQMTRFRASMREAGGTVKVAKNRLVKLALQGTEIEHISDLFQGPTLIAFSDDPVAAPKAVMDFAKGNDKLVVLGGALGSTNLNPDGVKSLATMPSLDELRAKLVGMINTPATRIAQVVNAPAGQLARVFNAYAEKDKAA